MTWDEIAPQLQGRGIDVVLPAEDFTFEISVMENLRCRDSLGRTLAPTVERHSLITAAERLAPVVPPVVHEERAMAQARARDLEACCDAIVHGQMPTREKLSRPEVRAAVEQFQRLRSAGSTVDRVALEPFLRRHRWLRNLKHSLAAMAPTVFHGGPSLQNGTITSMATFDYDDGTTIEEVVAALDGQVVGFIHTTLSHRPDAPRFRLLLPLAAPIDAQTQTRPFLRLLGGLLPGSPDRSGMNAAHRFLLPYRLYADGTYRALRLGGDHAGLLRLAAPDRLRSAPTGRQSLDGQSLANRPTLSHERRVEFCHELGGRVVAGNTSAKGVVCPSCGARSAWFSLLPERGPRAFCNHRRTCGWRGFIHEL